MSADIERAKDRLRSELGNRRRALEPAWALRAGRSVRAHLQGCPVFREATRVALYAALPDELPTRPSFEALRERGVEISFPRMEPGGLVFARVQRWEELEAGRYGVLEPPQGALPRTLEEVDVVLVPGLAFDARGNRLGRGGGHYDAALPAGVRGAGVVHPPTRIGLAYAFQLLPEVPHDSRDRQVDAIVTESGLQWCNTK